MRRVLAVVIAASFGVACSGDDPVADVTTTPAGSAGTTPTSVETLPSSTVPATTTPTSAPTTPASTMTDTTAAPPEGGGTATGALEDADVQIETEDGTIQIGVAEVPEGVSDTFPIPDDLDVQLSSATDTDFGFSGVSAMGIDELAEFYRSGLEEAGYEITERQEIEGVLAVYTFERPDEQGQVAISTAPGGAGSSVLVTIGDGSSRTEVSTGG